MPNTIAQNLQRLIAAKTAIAGAITAKGGTVESSDGLEDFATDIATIPSGGGGSTGSKVRLLDYDGTVLHEYTPTEFANLSSLPANPSHTGLTSNGWNWTLTDAKAYVAANDSLDIGQMYGLDQGFMNVNIHLFEGRLKPTMRFKFIGDIEIDWGDGSELEDVESDGVDNVFIQHVYPTPGDYVISIGYNSGDGATITSKNYRCGLLVKSQESNDHDDVIYTGCVRGINIFDFNNEDIVLDDDAFKNCYSLKTISFEKYSIEAIPSSAFQNCDSLTSITIPNGVTSIGAVAFSDCHSLTSITIPNSVTLIMDGAFNNCYSLTSITIPNSVTTIGGTAFNNCYSLTSITIPNGVTSIGSSAFQNCYSLTSITIPNSVTSIGGSTFSKCYSLKSITILNGVTSIGNNMFQYCQSLSSITIPNGVTSIGTQAFQYCYSLTSITIPNSVTSISNGAFNNCHSLTSITIPNGVTKIGNSTFSYCQSLPSITIPDGVTSIGSDAFYSCYSLSFVRFERNTPPTVNGSNAWSGIPTDCTIYAPALVVNTYMDKTNYPAKATYAYVGYATYESGETLPTLTTDETYTLTWYATPEDAVAQTNPITVGNGHEVYARATAV